MLTERGLPTALEELCRRAALPAHLQLDLDRRLPDQVESAAYFVASEALTNAAKHSHASEIRVKATYAGEVVSVEVADDGIGGAEAGRGTGLRGLADRVEALGGTLTVSSPLGPGYDAARGDPVRVVVADDAVHPARGPRTAAAGSRLRSRRGWPRTASELLELVERNRPDVAIVDIRMPPTHTDEGLQAAKVIRQRWPGDRHPRAVPARQRPLCARAAVRRAPTASATCSRSACRIWPSWPRASTGSVRAARCSTRRSSSQLVGRRRRGDNPLEQLTDREREVLALMAEGRSNQAIAERLFVTEHTVEKHVKNIFATLRLPPSPDDHRRVLAVVTFLNAQ